MDLTTPKLNARGQEVLDPRPLSIPVGFQRPLTLQEQIQRLMRVEYERMRLSGVDVSEMETPEEADDFDVGDDFDPSSPYEDGFMPDVVPEQPITSDKDFNPNSDKILSSDEADSSASKESTSA